MGYEIEYEKNGRREPVKPQHEDHECGGIEIKAENVFININCKEEKEKEREKENKDGYMGYKTEYEKEKNEKKEFPKPHHEENECGEIKIKAENVYINLNCKEKKERKDN